VPRATGGRVLRLLMNADLDEAVGILIPAEDVAISQTIQAEPTAYTRPAEDHSRWRLRMAQKIASELDARRFNVKGVYLFGSTRDATAGADADIDLIIHCDGSPAVQRELELWLEGWSLALAEINYQKTGCKRSHLLDARFVTSENVAKREGIAARIHAATDPARRLAPGIS